MRWLGRAYGVALAVILGAGAGLAACYQSTRWVVADDTEPHSAEEPTSPPSRPGTDTPPAPQGSGVPPSPYPDDPAAGALGRCEVAAADPRRWSSAQDRPPTLPRNIIFLMGDGMGPVHLQAARRRKGAPLRASALSGPRLYATDSLSGLTDSAAAATAMATGQCAHNGVLSRAGDGRPLETVLEIAQRGGKRVGLVTNAPLTDASPMAFAVHVGSRSCQTEIERQVVSTRPDVLFGGWIPSPPPGGEPGLAARARDAGYQVALELGQLEDPRKGPLLGLFDAGPSHRWPDWSLGLSPEAWRSEESDEPTLAQMTARALDHLAPSRRGFFLFVENELPDTLGHEAYLDPPAVAEIMPDVVLELDRALGVVLDWVARESSFDDTLVLLGSDHETGLYTLSGRDLSAATFPASPNHTSTPVALYARGPGSDRIARVQHIRDLFLLMTGRLDAPEAGRGCL